MMDIIKLIIDEIPPSMNKYLGNSHSYRIYGTDKKIWEWLIYAAVRNKIPNKPFIKSQINVTYFFKGNGRRDPDNYFPKLIMDPLVKFKLIKDDSFQCITVSVLAEFNAEKPRTEIVIIQLE